MAKSKQRGRKSLFPQELVDYLDGRYHEWQEARQSKLTERKANAVSVFYDNVTRDSIAQFGYDLELGDDATVSQAAPAEELSAVDNEKIPGLAGVSQEEAQRRVKYYTALRLVSIYLLLSFTTHSIDRKFLRGTTIGSERPRTSL